DHHTTTTLLINVNPVYLSVFQGKCRSKSMYSLQSAAVEQECVCCAAVKTEPLSVKQCAYCQHAVWLIVVVFTCLTAFPGFSKGRTDYVQAWPGTIMCVDY
uniref:Uncharacterized protein n=1 Tax=Poecilia reticulata TaxID=8081 RepID=A0A3P9NH41_POERE